MERILLKNGWIVDGSGRDRFQGDVLIEGKKIKTVSSFPLSGEGARILDCEGLVVAPGFIDGHSHQDHFFAVDDPHLFRAGDHDVSLRKLRIWDGRVSEGLPL